MPVQDTDNFLVCSSGYSYRITAAALKSKLNGGSSAAWTITTTPAGNQAFRGIGYGNGLYVACNSTGNVTNGVIYSSDGITLVTICIASNYKVLELCWLWHPWRHTAICYCSLR